MDKISVSTVIICCFVWLPVCHSDCVYKECFCTEDIIICGDSNLQAVPQLVKTNTAVYRLLEFGNNTITTIPADSLPPNLVRINFAENPIAFIDDTAFDESANTITSLFFSNTHLTRIPNAFGHLRAITDLYISGANISEWNDEAMMNLGHTLQTLVIDNVSMTTWPDWILNYSRLVDLTITRSTISSIPDNALDYMVNTLKSLYLYNNRLTMIPKAVSKLINLQTLYVEQNQIQDVSYLPQGSQLSSIALSNNKVRDDKQLSISLRPFSNCLTSIDLDNNELSSIPDISFLTKVLILDLTYNKISDPSSGSVPANLFDLDLSNNYLPSAPTILVSLMNVNNIHLSSNAIQFIQASDFHSQTISVDLSNNLISELSNTSFPEHSSIMYLKLNNNPISQISSAAFQHLPNLLELNLQSTQLTRLPSGLKLLGKLTTFDVSNSRNLVCTCLENSLTEWVMNLKQENVSGDCGHTTVYIFFSTLSPSCPTQSDFLEQ